MSFLRRLVKAAKRGDPTQRALGYFANKNEPPHPSEAQPVKKTGREKFAEFLAKANRR